MFLVNHHCPACGHVQVAPLTGVAEGDAGIWSCESCNTAYSIKIDFHPIAVTTGAAESADDLAESPEDVAAEAEQEHPELIEQRLHQLYGESALLRDRLDQLSRELQTLRDASTRKRRNPPKKPG